MIERSAVEALLTTLRAQQRELEAQLNATVGAIQVLERLLAEDEKPAETEG